VRALGGGPVAGRGTLAGQGRVLGPLGRRGPGGRAVASRAAVAEDWCGWTGIVGGGRARVVSRHDAKRAFGLSVRVLGDARVCRGLLRRWEGMREDVRRHQDVEEECPVGRSNTPPLRQTRCGRTSIPEGGRIGRK
jgi:hypothetical protein